jgi:hypothetical protein
MQALKSPLSYRRQTSHPSSSIRKIHLGILSSLDHSAEDDEEEVHRDARDLLQQCVAAALCFGKLPHGLRRRHARRAQWSLMVLIRHLPPHLALDVWQAILADAPCAEVAALGPGWACDDGCGCAAAAAEVAALLWMVPI